MSTSVYPPFRLSFMLPDSLAAFVRPGRHCPCLAGCLVTISRGYVAHIDGPTRAQVFAQTRRFLTEIAKDHPPLHIAAELVTDDRHIAREDGRRPYVERGWTIVLGAPVVLTRDWCPIVPPQVEPEEPPVADLPVYDGPDLIGKAAPKLVPAEAGIEDNGSRDGA